jgi:hypothetical protein
MCRCGKERDLFKLFVRAHGQNWLFVACREEVDSLGKSEFLNPESLDTEAPEWVPIYPELVDWDENRLARRNRRAGVFLLPILLFLLVASIRAGQFVPLLIAVTVACFVSMVRSNRIIRDGNIRGVMPPPGC